MALPPKCFFAYSAMPVDLAETIEASIEKINQRSYGTVLAKGWKTLNINGHIIIDQVCREIDKCDVFVADLTTNNLNVFFELGYAVAKDKRIWITLDASRPKAITSYSTRTKPFISLGYSGYENSDEFVNKFFDEKPFEEKQTTFLSDILKGITHQKSPTILYLKSKRTIDASIRLSKTLETSSIPKTIDDPSEIVRQPLTWYIENVLNSYAVVVHLLDPERDDDSEGFRNAVCSFVSGLAYGFGKHLLMLAQYPFVSPIDYVDFLRVHKTAVECGNLTSTWLNDISEGYEEHRRKYENQQRKKYTKDLLQQVDLGEVVAELEKDDLFYYFVETSEYRDALKTPEYILYVGRKGTGKTANLINVSRALLKDKRNYVCVIRPMDYELEGVLEVLSSNIRNANLGYLMESLWKFLIYTELAITVYRDIETKPMRTEDEKNFIDFVDSHATWILPEFTVRLERTMNEFCKIENSPTLEHEKIKISEIIHTKLLAKLRDFLGEILKKKKSVCLLIDNLDKAWRQRDDINILSQFLFGLLSAGQSISKDFQTQAFRKSPIQFSLIIFLRSDIYFYFSREARESDKLSKKIISWNDPLMLQKVIEQRFFSSFEDEYSSDELWENFFTPMVEGMPTKDYLTSRVIPRPRDIIFFCKAALSYAVSRGNSKIEVRDIMFAEKDYSQHAFDSLVAEMKPQINKIEDFLIDLTGCFEIVTKDEINNYALRSGIKDTEIERMIELLSDATFLGLQTSLDQDFEYLYEETTKDFIRSLARKVIEKTKLEQYKINIPFHKVLRIKYPS